MKRSDFPILRRRLNGQPLVYFDNAATSQKPQAVLAAMDNFYRRHNANVHRALNPLSGAATDLYEGSRRTVAKFIGAQPEQIIFTRGATEGLNLVAKSWGAKFLKPGDIVLITKAEHHANIVPWLQLKESLKIKLAYIDILDSGELDLLSARRWLAQPRVKLLAVTGASNVLGLVNPLGDLFAWARRAGICTVLDASQLAAHQALDFQALACDFLVFSGHKLGGPTGIGVLAGRETRLKKMPPFMGGGEMISEVREQSFVASSGPSKFEAGTPPIAEAIGLAAAMEYINSLGWEKIGREEAELSAYFLQRLDSLPTVELIGTAAPRLPIFSLKISGLHPHDAADLLGQAGIMLRAGFHCAEPLHRRFGGQPTLRASLSFYNTKAEIEYFFSCLAELQHKFSSL